MASLENIKHIVMVLSGKGGVGKSTVACQLALSLAHQYHLRVGLLDVDICGPSVPKICGLEGRDVYRDDDGWRPVEMTVKECESNINEQATHEQSECTKTVVDDDVDKESASTKDTGSLKVMSIAYLLPSDKDAVVWRGPKKDAMIKQFINDVKWGNLDYLVIDTPPGTSDEHLTLCEVLSEYNPTGAIVVTTPQEVATDDVKKELSFCHKLHIRCLGVVENMCGFVCPYCAHCTDIFSRGGGRRLAERYEIPYLGAIPIDPQLAIAEDQGRAFTETADKQSQTVQAVNEVINAIQQQVARAEAQTVQKCD